MFLCGPVSTEFQFHATLEFQFVNPSWCLLVNTKYLKDNRGAVTLEQTSPPDGANCSQLSSVGRDYVYRRLRNLTQV